MQNQKRLMQSCFAFNQHGCCLSCDHLSCCCLTPVFLQFPGAGTVLQIQLPTLTGQKKHACYFSFPSPHFLMIYMFLYYCSQHQFILRHFTCLLRNLYAGQEATVRTRLGTMDWFQIRIRVHHAVYCNLAYLT